MTATQAQEPVLLCFDGSEGACTAIAVAGKLLGKRQAVVATVWEPLDIWEPYDPGAIVSVGVSALGGEALGLDEVARDLARSTVEEGVKLAKTSGFNVEPRVVGGKPWRAICDLAEEIDAASIVLGARGLSRVESLILGSVSAAVLVHAHCPVLVIPPEDS